MLWETFLNKDIGKISSGQGEGFMLSTKWESWKKNIESFSKIDGQLRHGTEEKNRGINISSDFQ